MLYLFLKAPTMKVKFLVEQIEFMLDGEVEAHEILADYINEPYEEIVKEKVWPPSGVITLNICIIMLIHTKCCIHYSCNGTMSYVYEVVAKWGLEFKS